MVKKHKITAQAINFGDEIRLFYKKKHFGTCRVVINGDTRQLSELRLRQWIYESFLEQIKQNAFFIDEL
jgi:hypothetical protein